MIITVQIEDIAVQIADGNDDKTKLMETAKEAALDLWKKRNCFICDEDEDEQEIIN